MRTEATMRELIRALHGKGASEDLIVAIVSILETDDNFMEMRKELTNMQTPSETCLLATAMLIAEP